MESRTPSAKICTISLCGYTDLTHLFDPNDVISEGIFPQNSQAEEEVMRRVAPQDPQAGGLQVDVETQRADHQASSKSGLSPAILSQMLQIWVQQPYSQPLSGIILPCILLVRFRHAALYLAQRGLFSESSYHSWYH